MAHRPNPLIRGSLLSRRSLLEHAHAASPADAQIKSLLDQVDAALERMDGDDYGLCAVCRKPIESDRLLAHPLVCFCLDHLTPPQQRALENDIQIAARIQRGLLPQEDLEVPGWRTAYLYEGAGIVSGDHCDLFANERGLHFAVGDVSGKGVAAAMLMAHLHATCRALISQALPLDDFLLRVNRMLCESTLPTRSATLSCGRANASGEVEFCIAGHLPALIVRGTRIEAIGATGLPLGMFGDGRFSVHATRLEAGESIVLYTDGLSEAVNLEGSEYGIERLASLLRSCGGEPPREIIIACLADLEAFRGGAVRTDDLTVMVLRKL